jgi:hypothetical protein
VRSVSEALNAPESGGSARLQSVWAACCSTCRLWGYDTLLEHRDLEMGGHGGGDRDRHDGNLHGDSFVLASSIGPDWIRSRQSIVDRSTDRGWGWKISTRRPAQGTLVVVQAAYVLIWLIYAMMVHLCVGINWSREGRIPLILFAISAGLCLVASLIAIRSPICGLVWIRTLNDANHPPTPSARARLLRLAL